MFFYSSIRKIFVDNKENLNVKFYFYNKGSQIPQLLQSHIIGSGKEEKATPPLWHTQQGMQLWVGENGIDRTFEQEPKNFLLQLHNYNKTCEHNN